MWFSSRARSSPSTPPSAPTRASTWLLALATTAKNPARAAHAPTPWTAPKPLLGGAHVHRSTCQSSQGWSPWDLFWLGLVQTSKIELEELRRSDEVGGHKYDGSRRRGKDANAASNMGGEGAPKFQWSRELNCNCSAAAMETVSSRIVVLRGKKGILVRKQKNRDYYCLLPYCRSTTTGRSQITTVSQPTTVHC